MQFLYSKSGRINRFLFSLLGMLLIRKYRNFVALDAKIGMGLSLAHPNGIVNVKCVEIGNN